jgi:serine/threonine protein kinase
MANELNCPHCGKPVPEGSPLGICPECLLKAGAGPGASGQVPASTGATAAAKDIPYPAPGELAPHFPQLEILGFIARGGMGAVYKARQPNLDRLVALKILLLATSNDPGFADRFKREARSMAKLNHPNILAVHDFGQTGGFCYLVMEFVDGVNLRQIEQAGEFTPREALQIIPQICEALQFAHDEGIVHRDIKPENILIDKKGRVKIADFGLAKLLDPEGPTQNFTQGNYVMGTPHYMAPEQIERPLEVDHRADIYSLGVVFYEMLTGELPLGRFASPSQKARIDVRLDEVVMRTLEKEPALRYQQASQVKTAVETIAADAAPAPPPPVKNPAPVAAPIPSPSARKPAWRMEIIVGLFLLAAIFTAVAYYFAVRSTAVDGVPIAVATSKPVPSTLVSNPSVASAGNTAANLTVASPSQPAVPLTPVPVPGAELHIVSGVGGFSAVSASNKTLMVSPGAKLSGKIKLEARNLGPANAIAPLVFTPSWGEPSRSWHTIQNSIPAGETEPQATIALTAPASPGVYHLIFAFQWQIDGDYVASATNWTAGASRWNDGRTLASVSAQQIANAQANGSAMVNWLMQNKPPTYAQQRTPMDALTIVVAGADGATAPKP